MPCFCTGACQRNGGRCPAASGDVGYPNTEALSMGSLDYIRKRAKELDVPVIEPLPPPPPPRNPQGVIAICGQCGLEITRVMGYVCHNQRCPTGLGGPVCSKL